MERSHPRRQFLAVLCAVGVPLTAGCFHDDDNARPSKPDREPDVQESISEETEWTFELSEGDSLWIEIEDGSETNFITREIIPPEGSTSRQTQTSFDQSWTARHSGEHIVRVDPEIESEVKIWAL